MKSKDTVSYMWEWDNRRPALLCDFERGTLALRSAVMLMTTRVDFSRHCKISAMSDSYMVADALMATALMSSATRRASWLANSL